MDYSIYTNYSRTNPHTECYELTTQWTIVFARTMAVLIPIPNVAKFELNGLPYLHEP